MTFTAPSMDVTEWVSTVEWMERHVRSTETWFFVMPRFSPDEVAAATEVLTGRLGWCPQIYGADDLTSVPRYATMVVSDRGRNPAWKSRLSR